MGLKSQISGMRVRLRLTLLYGALFLLSGAVLLAVTYLLVAHGRTNVEVSALSRSPSGERSLSVYQGDGAPADPRLPAADRRIVQAVRDQAVRQQAETMHRLLVQSGVALAVMSVIATALGWLVAGRVLRPLQTMTAGIRRISARNVHERLALTGPRDELRDLADTVDGLLGRLDAALDSHRRFVANAAHELRTPLTVEHALLEEALIDPDATAESFRARFRQLMVVSEQQARLLESLLVLATSERGLDRLEDVDLAGLTGEVLRGAEPEARRRGVAVAARNRPARIAGDPALVERLVANLVDNALSYNVADGQVDVATGMEGARPFLSVANTGPPVPPEMTDRLLSPFQRLGRTADGGHHGLGLSIVQAIAAAHSADLAVVARPDGGLDVKVLFPEEEKPGKNGQVFSVPVV
ncbi:sensor histidine kinase [Actinomadura macrotermitis]|uniref:histidine kinase n=1 Tax=Actinomadura macrotermitis TaxID=2585200 RepID=A0A7K0BWH0_9ACTN|nr:ATP-binding protein [Actinomadura macrotermitis]MQY05507.1 Adaptive-response sensory-kinase SasA [Actinomadura macrotermitis]